MKNIYAALRQFFSIQEKKFHIEIFIA